MFDGRWEMEKGGWTMESREWEMENREWEIGKGLVNYSKTEIRC